MVLRNRTLWMVEGKKRCVDVSVVPVRSFERPIGGIDQSERTTPRERIRRTRPSFASSRTELKSSRQGVTRAIHRIDGRRDDESRTEFSGVVEVHTV